MGAKVKRIWLGKVGGSMNFNELKQMVGESSNIVFFGGVGTSTESGIPDFRSAEGLYYSGTDRGIL
jgi:hypothetical protein